MLLDISLIGWHSAYNITDSSSLKSYFVLLARCGVVTLQDVVCSAAVVKNTQMFRTSIWSVLNCCMPPLLISYRSLLWHVLVSSARFVGHWSTFLPLVVLPCDFVQNVSSYTSSQPTVTEPTAGRETILLQCVHCAGVVHRAVYNNLFVFFVASQWSVELERLSTIFFWIRYSGSHWDGWIVWTPAAVLT